jgi:hypothetical protein
MICILSIDISTSTILFNKLVMAEPSVHDNEELIKDPPIPPDGFIRFHGPDNEFYLIPKFLSEKTRFAFHLQGTKEAIRPDSAAGGVSS